jgi:hypothetical protein
VAELIQRPDLTFRLQQYLGLREARPLRHLAAEVSPVVVIGDVREVADEKVIERPCSGVIYSLTSDFFGSHVAVTLTNPAGSGVVVRVHEIEIGSLGAYAPANLRIEPAAPIGGPVADLAFRDDDNAGRRPAAILSADNTVIYPGPVHYVLQPSTGRNWKTGWTLVQGMQVRLDSFEQSGAGSSQQFAFMWTESTVRAS